MKKPSQRELAKRWQVHESTIRNWKKSGVDVCDDAAVRAHVLEIAGRPTSTTTAGLTAAREEKTRLECQILAHRLAVEEGKYLAVEDVDERDLRTGSIVKAMFMRLRADLPPLLCGLASAEMEEAIEAYAYERLQDVAQEDPAKFEVADGGSR